MRNLIFLITLIFGLAVNAANLLPNGGFESAAAKWRAYCDAAGTAPVDGIGGGVAGFAISSSTTSPLDGKSSGLITKDAANRQGCGVSTDFTAKPNKVYQVKLNYKVTSGTYTEDAYKVYIYDIVNNELKEVSPVFVKNSLLEETYSGVVQTGLGTSYRLIVHNASTNAVAVTMKIDEGSVDDQPKAQGSFASDWQTYTNSCSGSWTTNTTYECKMRYVGDSAEFQIKVNLTGAPNAVQLSVNLPVSVDSAKMVSNFGAVGSSTFQDSGVSSTMGGIQILSGIVYPYTSTYPGSGVTTTIPFTWGTNDSLTLDFRVPVVGKSSNTTLSNEYLQRKVFAQYKTTGGVTSYGSGQIIKYTSMVEDTHGAYNPATGLFTCPTNDFFKVTNQFYGVGAYSYNYIGKNGSSEFTRMVQASASGFPASFTVPCKTGETIGIYNAAAGATSVDGSSFNSITIETSSGGTQVVSSEQVNARYVTTAGQSFTNGAEIVTGFENKTFDNTNSASGSGTSWKWKCPKTGYPTVNASISMYAGWNTGESLLVSVYKNNSLWGSLARNYVTGSWTGVLIANGSIKVQCNTGDDLEIRTYQDSGATASMGTDGRYNFVEFYYQ